jgi:hypothetical protein
MYESASLILNNFFNGGMAVANIHLPIIGLKIDISITVMVVEILHVSLGDHKWGFVMSLIKICEMFLSFGNDFLGIACEGLGGVCREGEMKRGEVPT